MYAPATLANPDIRAVIARLGVALIASIALHAVIAAAIALAPDGTPWGDGDRTRTTLQARIVPASPTVSPAQPALRTPVAAKRQAPAEDPAPASPAHNGAGRAADTDEQALGLVPETTYYAASELDARPQPTMDITPPYPRAAPPDGGYVVIELLIDETGGVDRVHIAVADPEGVFDRAVVDAFSAARFTPGLLRGTAVKSRMWMELRFHPIALPDAASATAAGPTAR